MDKLNLSNIKKEISEIATNYNQLSHKHNNLVKVHEEKQIKIKQLLLQKQIIDFKEQETKNYKNNNSYHNNTSSDSINYEKNINNAINKLTTQQKNRINSSMISSNIKNKLINLKSKNDEVMNLKNVGKKCHLYDDIGIKNIKRINKRRL